MYSDGSLYNIEIIFNRLEMNFLGGRRLWWEYKYIQELGQEEEGALWHSG